MNLSWEEIPATLPEVEVAGSISLYRSLIIFSNEENYPENLLTYLYKEIWGGQEHHVDYSSLKDQLTELGYDVADFNFTDYDFFNEDTGWLKDLYLQYKKDKDIKRLWDAINIVLVHRPSFTCSPLNVPDTILKCVCRAQNSYHYSIICLYSRNKARAAVRLYNKLKHYPKKDFFDQAFSIMKHRNGALQNLWDSYLQRECYRRISLQYEELEAYDSTVTLMTFKHLFYMISSLENVHLEPDNTMLSDSDIEKLTKILADLPKNKYPNTHVEI